MPTHRSGRGSIPPPPKGTPDIHSIADRLGADARFAGRGVTMAFLDAGFYAHADLTTPRNRIMAYNDVLARRTYRNTMPEPDASSWHGMMTSVVCAGNGSLSGGLFKGLAYEADLVLVKVGSMSRVRHDDIRQGIVWVLEHRERYNIRVLNISCGGDYEASYLTDAMSNAAQDAVRAGITVVVAVGNAGHDANHVIFPPASVPAVITVGGLDDAGGASGHVGLYHSSYGPTIDGLQKPEVIAPAIWLAAPILPGTPTAAQATVIAALARAQTDDELHAILQEHHGVDPEFDAAANRDGYHIRNILDLKRRDSKVISRHYKHVDGTSFSAPIVASVVAQMLEANPGLSPAQVKRVLMDTAKRLPGVPVERQGWGVVQPKEAVARALAKRV